MDAERQRFLQSIVVHRPIAERHLADASAGINAVCTLLSKYTRTPFYYASQKNSQENSYKK
ncbi:hypothetical protein ACVDG8_026275 [Mesorhizobium sp. ORM8.1]